MTDEQFMKERLMGDRIERKALGFQLESIEEDGTFSGHAAAFGNIDNGGDVILPGAFARTIKEDFDRIKSFRCTTTSNCRSGSRSSFGRTRKGFS